MKIKRMNVIDIDDWNQLIKDTYKKPYDIELQEIIYLNNSYYLEVPEEINDYPKSDIDLQIKENIQGTSFENWLKTSPEDTLPLFQNHLNNDFFWQEYFYPHLSILMQDVIEKGLLPNDTYHIYLNESF